MGAWEQGLTSPTGAVWVLSSADPAGPSGPTLAWKKKVAVNDYESHMCLYWIGYLRATHNSK